MCKLFSILTLISILASGCGGGNGTSTNSGGNGSPTDINLDFKLYPDNYFTNYDVSASLTGSDNRGITLTGSISEKTLPTTTFLGESSIPIQTKMDFTASNGGFASATLDIHYGMNANDRRFLGIDGDVVTVSATTNTIPQTARIGDAGSVGVYIRNNNFETTLSWRLEDGLNGNAKLLFLDTTNNQSGELDNTFTTTYLIKPDGTRLSVQLITFNVNINTEVTLDGDY